MEEAGDAIEAMAHDVVEGQTASLEDFHDVIAGTGADVLGIVWPSYRGTLYSFWGPELEEQKHDLGRLRAQLSRTIQEGKDGRHRGKDWQKRVDQLAQDLQRKHRAFQRAVRREKRREFLRLFSALAETGDDRSLYRLCRLVQRNASSGKKAVATEEEAAFWVDMWQSDDLFDSYVDRLAMAGDPGALIAERLWNDPRGVVPEELITALRTDFPLSEPLSQIHEKSFESVEVMVVASKCKGEASGPDGLPPRVLSQVSKAHPDAVANILTAAYRNLPPSVDAYDGCVTLIPKGGAQADPPRPGCSRPITVLNSAAKLLQACVAHRIRPYLDDLLSTNQYGCRPNRSVSTTVAMMMAIHMEAVRDRKPLFVLFVDIAKAFDTVPITGLLMKLLRKGFPLGFVRWVAAMLSERRVTFKGDTSMAKLRTTRGVPQGSPLSPLFFELFLDDVVEFMQPGGVVADKVTIGDGDEEREMSSLLFVDDIALMAHSIEELRRLWTALLEWTSRWQLNINYGKTKSMILTKGRLVRKRLVEELGRMIVGLNNEPIEVVNQFTYLGYPIGENRGDHFQVPTMSIDRGNLVASACWTLTALLRAGRNVGTSVARSLLLTKFLPGLTFSADLLKFNDRLGPIWNRMVRLIIGVESKEHSVLSLRILGVRELPTYAMRRMLRFAFKLACSRKWHELVVWKVFSSAFGWLNGCLGIALNKCVTSPAVCNGIIDTIRACHDDAERVWTTYWNSVKDLLTEGDKQRYNMHKDKDEGWPAWGTSPDVVFTCAGVHCRALLRVMLNRWNSDWGIGRFGMGPCQFCQAPGGGHPSHLWSCGEVPQVLRGARSWFWSSKTGTAIRRAMDSDDQLDHEWELQRILLRQGVPGVSRLRQVEDLRAFWWRGFVEWAKMVSSMTRSRARRPRAGAAAPLATPATGSGASSSPTLPPAHTASPAAQTTAMSAVVSAPSPGSLLDSFTLPPTNSPTPPLVSAHHTTPASRLPTPSPLLFSLHSPSTTSAQDSGSFLSESDVLDTMNAQLGPRPGLYNKVVVLNDHDAAVRVLSAVIINWHNHSPLPVLYAVLFDSNHYLALSVSKPTSQSGPKKTIEILIVDSLNGPGVVQKVEQHLAPLENANYELDISFIATEHQGIRNSEEDLRWRTSSCGLFAVWYLNCLIDGCELRDPGTEWLREARQDLHLVRLREVQQV